MELLGAYGDNSDSSPSGSPTPRSSELHGAAPLSSAPAAVDPGIDKESADEASTKSDGGLAGPQRVGLGVSGTMGSMSEWSDADEADDKSSALPPPRSQSKTYEDFEAAVEALTNMPEGVQEFLRCKVAKLRRNESVCLQVSAAIGRAHDFNGGQTFDAISEATSFDSARLRRLGPWHFMLSMIGKAGADKQFKDELEIKDQLFLFFQLGYYRPEPLGHTTGKGSSKDAEKPSEKPSETGSGGASNGNNRNDKDSSKDTEKPSEKPSEMGSGGTSSGSNGSSASGSGAGSNGASAGASGGPEEARATDAASSDVFMKEGARIEHFIYMMCADSLRTCLTRPSRPHH